MPKISERRIFGLIGSLYDCAQANTPASWLEVYKDMADIFSSGPGSLSLYSPEKDLFDFVAHTFPADHLISYYEHFQYVSPVRKAIARLKPGERFWRLRDCPDDDFVGTEFYQDHLKKIGIYDINYFALFERNGISGAMGFTRSQSAGPFSDDQVKAMNFILPHIQRAFMVFLAVTDAERKTHILAETLSRIPRCVIVVDRSSKIVFVNDAAEKVIAAKDGLDIDRHGRIFASLSQESKHLRLVLDGVFDPDLNRSANFGGAMQVSRPSGQRALQLLISPITEQSFTNLEAETLAIIFVHDPEHDVATVEDVLRQMYGLTIAEARLAAILASGKSLKEAREKLDVSQNTVRTHLKHIFSKTDTNRQSELVTLILSGPAHLKSAF